MEDAIAILRVSSQKQSDNLSLATQLSVIEHYCKEVGLDLVESVSIIESAKDADKRKQYNKEIKYSIKKGYKHIVYSHYDRECRNLIDIERSEKLVKSLPITVHYANDRKAYNKNTSDSDFYVRDITAANNKQFLRNLGTKINGGTKMKAEQGWFPASKLPLGYIHFKPLNASRREIRKFPTIITPDPNPQIVKMVQREFELRAKSYSFDKIRETIIEEGFIEYENSNKYFCSAIEKRLKNKFYRGYFDWQEIEYKGAHPLIISEEILDAVDATFEEKGLQEIVSANKTQAIFGGGYFKCKICGCNIVHEHKRKISKNGKVTVYDLYRCSNGKRMHQGLKGLYVRESDIWITLARVIDEITITKALAEQIKEALNATHIQAKEARKKAIDDYSKELDIIDSKDNKLFDMYTQSLLDEEGFRRQSARLKEDRRHYTQLLKNISEQIDDKFFDTVKSTIELGINAKLLWNLGTDEKRKILLDELLSNRFLNGASVEYDLKSPFKELADLRKNDDKKFWYPQGDSNPCFRRERATS